MKDFIFSLQRFAEVSSANPAKINLQLLKTRRKFTAWQEMIRLQATTKKKLY